jgi:hypothetical protein
VYRWKFGPLGLAGLIWITPWPFQTSDNDGMWTRRVLVLLMLCLPLRLWAGVGLMQSAFGTSSAAVTVAQAADEHGVYMGQPCHEEALSVAQADVPPTVKAQPQHCNSGDCQICSVCHMPALHTAVWLDATQIAPNAWVASKGLSASSAPATALFKPPVS